MVYIWFIYGLYMVYIWFIYGLYMVYRTHFCWFGDGFLMKFTALVDFPSYKPPFTCGISQPVTVAGRYAKTK